MKSKPLVSIITLNWNSWQHTIECLESLLQISYPNYNVIVIDNGSTDDSMEKIKDYLKGRLYVKSKFIKKKVKKPIPFVEIKEKDMFKVKIAQKIRVILLKASKNYFYSGGNNLGIQFAQYHFTPDYFLLLNNDVVVDKNFLTELIKVGESDVRIGMLSPKIYYYNTPNILQSTGGKIIWPICAFVIYGEREKDKGQFERIGERDYLFGTSLLIKKEVVKKIGLLDTFFIFGIEEYDYCTRARKAGFKLVYVPSSYVWHKVGGSSKKLNKFKRIKKFIAYTQGIGQWKYIFRLYLKHRPYYLFLFPFVITLRIFWKAFIVDNAKLYKQFVNIKKRVYKTLEVKYKTAW